jgi:hypothetical protein
MDVFQRISREIFRPASTIVMIILLSLLTILPALAWPLAAQAKPTTRALDEPHARVFVGCRNQILLVLDGTSWKKLASLKIGKWVDDTVYDPVRRRILLVAATIH